jgi:hypothetical protein
MKKYIIFTMAKLTRLKNLEKIQEVLNKIKNKIKSEDSE